ncbi:MAG: DUF6262 family protein [Cyanobacteria bacterium J06629_18]
MLKRNTSGLETHAHQKRESALKRAEEAITRLQQTNQPVNFKTVSEESGVSRTWLYKESDIKDRINQIKQKKTSKSSDNKNVYNYLKKESIDTSQLYELQQKVKKLETENYALRNHLEVVYGIADPELVEKVKALQSENEALKKQLKHDNNKINSQLLQKIQSLESENHKLKEDNRQIHQLKVDLKSAQQKLHDYQQSEANSQPNLVLLSQRRTESISIDDDSIIENIKLRVNKIGIRLNKKLNELIKSLEKEQVQNAVSAVEEYLATGKRVKSKAGLFRKALEEAWIPNLTDEERIISQTKDIFSEWYTLAKEEGIVQASQATKEGILVLEPTGEWTSFEAMLEKGWTLEYLKERVKR